MKLFLIDGHALIFKMYYAFLGRPMVNSKGEDTSILFGFTKYLLELIEREKPTHIAVAFDPPGGTFRNQLYPEYKANRAETPQLVIDALEPLTSIVKSMGIPVLMVKGFEADDVIGSMAKRSAGEGFDVYMVTPDKDYGQLIAPRIYQYKPGKGGSDKEVYGVDEICEKYKIESPEQIIDILTLCGDSSDNVPGVQGVGPVGAAKFLRVFTITEFPNEQQVTIILIIAGLPMLMECHTIIVRICRMANHFDITECHLNILITFKVCAQIFQISRFVLYLICNLLRPRLSITGTSFLHRYCPRDNDGIVTENPVDGL